MKTPPMLRQMRHDVWATGKLLERCRSLTKEQLEFTAPGMYGSIQKTFAHIVRANEGYLNTYGVIPQPFLELTAPPDEIASRLDRVREADRKSTRLNSSHTVISYAVFCLKK